MNSILIDEDDEIKIVNGTMAIGPAAADTTGRLIRANKGEFKEFPLLGGEIAKVCNGVADPFWPASIKEQLKECGVEIKRIAITDNGIEVE